MTFARTGMSLFIRSRNFASLVCALLCCLGPTFSSALAQSANISPSQPHFDLGPETVLEDEAIPIVLSGIPPGRAVTIRLHGTSASSEWSSSAIFTSDSRGIVDLTHTAPIRGDYEGIDPMGLFWSTRRNQNERFDFKSADPSAARVPEPWKVTAELDGAVVATATVWRRAVAADVTITKVHDRGLVGTFYQPSGEGRHPAVIVVSGSNGGVPPAASMPGAPAS